MHVRPGRCAATVVNNIADVDLFQSGSEMYQDHARSTCPSPEDREATPSSSWESGYAASDSPRSFASSHDQSRFFTNASRSNYHQPQYETDDESQEVAKAADALRLFCISPATTGPGTTTKRQRVEVGSDESNRAQMEWPRKRGTGAVSSHWSMKKRR